MAEPSDLQKDIEAELRAITGEEAIPPDLQLLEEVEAPVVEDPEAIGESIESMVADIEADLGEMDDESDEEETAVIQEQVPEMSAESIDAETLVDASPSDSGKSQLQSEIESEYALLTGSPPPEVSATAAVEEEAVTLESEFGIEAAEEPAEDDSDDEAFAAEALAMEAEADPIDAPQEEPVMEEAENEEDDGDYVIDRQPLWEGSDEVNAAEFSSSELKTIMNEINDLEESAKSDSPEDLAMTDEDLAKKTALQDEIEAQISAIKPDFNKGSEKGPVVNEEPSESLEISPAPSVEPLAMEEPSEALEVSPPPKVEPLAMEAPPKVEPLAMEQAPKVEPLVSASGGGEASAPPSSPPPQAPSMPAGSPAGISFGASGNMNLNLNFPIGDKTVQINVDGDKGLTCVLDDFTLNISEKNGLTINIPTNKKVS